MEIWWTDHPQVVVAVLALCMAWAAHVTSRRGYTAFLGLGLGFAVGIFGVAVAYLLPNRAMQCAACGTRRKVGTTTCPACRTVAA